MEEWSFFLFHQNMRWNGRDYNINKGPLLSLKVKKDEITSRKFCGLLWRVILEERPSLLLFFFFSHTQSITQSFFVPNYLILFTPLVIRKMPSKLKKKKKEKATYVNETLIHWKLFSLWLLWCGACISVCLTIKKKATWCKG